jgi:CheY-like chemotaxis protein
MIGKLGSAIDELNNTFNHILDIANLETGQQIPTLAAVDINILLMKLENQFAPQASKHGLKLKVRLRSRPPYTVYSDACILNQIIGNLIDNAIKYTASGWILITAVKVDGNRLKLHVRDSGIGIPDELRGEIFKEFFRGHRRQADSQAHGLGIGLAYVLKATERLPNHSLQVSSRLHQGSDFQLCLPVVDIAPQRICVPPQQPSFAGSFVFIVDADHQVLHAMDEQLTAWGCLVQTAASKAETHAALAENIRPPDLLITDFYLDDNETAHDIIAAIQADSGPVQTLILSGHAIPDEDKAKWPEHTLLLRKPTSAAVLIETMAKAMGK